MCISSVKMSKKSSTPSLTSHDLSLDQILSLQSLSSQLLAACETSPRRRRTRRGSRDRRKPESCDTSTASSTSEVPSFRWEDLLQKCDPDASLQEVVAAIASKGTGTKAKKTSICKYWANSTCANIECNFAHGMAELQYTPGIYKTTICKYWKTRTCTEGDKCRHAHGRKELRPKNFPEHIMRNKLLERMKEDLIRLHKLKHKTHLCDSFAVNDTVAEPANISRAELEALKRLCDSLLQLRSQDNSLQGQNFLQQESMSHSLHVSRDSQQCTANSQTQEESNVYDMAPSILNNLQVLLKLMQQNSPNLNNNSYSLQDDCHKSFPDMAKNGADKKKNLLTQKNSLQELANQIHNNFNYNQVSQHLSNHLSNHFSNNSTLNAPQNSIQEAQHNFLRNFLPHNANFNCNPHNGFNSNQFASHDSLNFHNDLQHTHNRLPNTQTNFNPSLQLNAQFPFNSHDFSFQHKFNAPTPLKTHDDMFSPTIVNHINTWLENE